MLYYEEQHQKDATQCWIRKNIRRCHTMLDYEEHEKDAKHRFTTYRHSIERQSEENGNSEIGKELTCR